MSYKRLQCWHTHRGDAQADFLLARIIHRWGAEKADDGNEGYEGEEREYGLWEIEHKLIIAVGMIKLTK